MIESGLCFGASRSACSSAGSVLSVELLIKTETLWSADVECQVLLIKSRVGVAGDVKLEQQHEKKYDGVFSPKKGILLPPAA